MTCTMECMDNLKPLSPRLTLRRDRRLFIQDEMVNDARIEIADMTGQPMLDITAKRVSWLDVRLKSVRMSGCAFLQTHLTDCLVQECDLANNDLSESMLVRVRVVESKLTGISAPTLTGHLAMTHA